MMLCSSYQQNLTRSTPKSCKYNKEESYTHFSFTSVLKEHMPILPLLRCISLYNSFVFKTLYWQKIQTVLYFTYFLFILCRIFIKKDFICRHACTIYSMSNAHCIPEPVQTCWCSPVSPLGDRCVYPVSNQT